MPLNATNGSQVEAINRQGIEVNKNHVAFHLDWVDVSTNRYFDPTTYGVTITHNSNPYSESNLKVMTPLSREDESTGVWIYEFLTKDMVAGDYVFTFTGSATGIATVTHTVGFKAAEIPVEQYFVGCLRARLGDKRTKRYIIDDSARTRWTNGELYSFLENARMDIGQTPPQPMDLAFNVLYGEAHDLLLMGGFIQALESRGVFEMFNRFQYSDELSLNVDRTPFFQNAQALRSMYDNMKKSWKRDRMFHTVRGIGLASGKFPMYYSRILSLLPNMQSVFYG